MRSTQRLTVVSTLLVYLAILAPIYLCSKTPNAGILLFQAANAIVLLAVLLSMDSNPVRRFGKWCSRHATAILAVTVCCITIVFSVLNYLKFINYGFVGEDFAKFAQSFYSTTYRHQLFANSYTSTQFGIHFSPFLFVLCPVYRVYPHPLVLIFAKVIALSLSMIPVYLIARDALSRMAALIIACAYLMSPAVLGQFLFEFYELQFAPLMIGLCLYSFLKKKKTFFFLCLFALISIREEMGLFAVALGIYSVILRREMSWSGSLLIIGTVSIIASYFFIIPHFNPSGKYQTILITGEAGDMMPSTLYINLISVENIKYAYFLLAPVLIVLPFLNPSCILSIPFIVGVLFAGKLTTKWIGYHYHAFTMLTLFTSCILSLRRSAFCNSPIKTPGKGVSLRRPCILLMLFVALSLTRYQFVPYFRNEIMTPYGWDNSIPLPEYKRALTEAIALIPPQASVAVPRCTAPHFANRDHLYCDLPVERPDYLLIDKNTKDEAMIRRLNDGFLINGYQAGYKSIYCKSGISVYRRAYEAK